MVYAILCVLLMKNCGHKIGGWYESWRRVGSRMETDDSYEEGYGPLKKKCEVEHYEIKSKSSRDA